VGAWTPALLAGERFWFSAAASLTPYWLAVSVATANGGLRSRTHHTPLADERARHQKTEHQSRLRHKGRSGRFPPNVTHRGWVGRMGAGPHSRLPQKPPTNPALTKQRQNPTKHRPRAGPENSRHAHPLTQGTRVKSTPTDINQPKPQPASTPNTAPRPTLAPPKVPRETHPRPSPKPPALQPGACPSSPSTPPPASAP